MPSAYLTSGQAARLLGLSRQTLVRAARRGEVPVALRTPGGRLRFDPDAVQAYARRLGSQDAGAALAEVDNALSRAPDLLRIAFASMACGVVIRDASGRVADANAAAQDILGVPLDELRGRPLGVALGAITAADGSLLSSEERPVVRAARTGQPQRNLLIGLLRPDGSRRWLQLDAVPAQVAIPPGPVVVSFIDVTDRLHVEEALRASQEQLRVTFEQAAVGLAHLDLTGRWVRVNRHLCAMLGYTPEELRARTLPELTHADEDLGATLALIARLCAGEIESYTLEKRYRHKDGATVWVTETLSHVGASVGTDAYLLAAIEDITARKQAEVALQHQALHDALTGLPNRALLYDRVEQALRMAAREHTPLALFLLDLDRFKEVNDTLGHDAGDTLLCVVAARLRDALRASDTVARLGGDEFALLLPGADTVHALQIASTLLSTLAEPMTVAGLTLAISGSLGIAMYPGHGADVATLLRRADMAMYTAKRAGDGHALYSAELDQHGPLRLNLIGALQHAISHEELRLHYQPTVDVESGRVQFVEALVRWQHPLEGLIMPDRFIPLAEQTGLIIPLTRWVLEVALRQVHNWEEAGLHLGVAINLSARVLRDTELPAMVAAALRDHAVPARKLRVELTESMVMADPTAALAMLTELDRLGVRIAIDDFGTGYSSLAYLKRLPIDEIKLDKSFIIGMNGDTNNATIVASTIGLGHSLGLRFVAEGVETRAVLDQLTALGCDRVQGFFVSRALPADELAQWLRSATLRRGIDPAPLYDLPRTSGTPE